jgi:ABC-type polysaccharide/polyol phosphate export permease
MSKLFVLKDNLSQILALTEKNVKLSLRYKSKLLTSFIFPLVSIAMPLIILRKFTTLNIDFGPWSNLPFTIYTFLAYMITLVRGIADTFPNLIRQEKFWKTLPALIIAPFNRINILFSIFFTHIILISIPFMVMFIISYIIFPISFITFLNIMLIFFLIALIFSGIGLFFGIFAISNEGLGSALKMLFTFVLWFSCITYPFEIFPSFIQPIININPFYYIFDFLRRAWMDNNFISTITSFPLHLGVLLIGAIIIPLTSVFIFNKVYKKYGIVGY